MRKLIFVLIILLGLMGCSEIKEKSKEKRVKDAIQSELSQKYGKYNLVVSKVDLTGNGVYQGQMEVLYDGKPYSFPVSVNGDSYQYKFDPYIIKEEAEVAIKKMVNETMKEANWKQYGITVTGITLIAEGVNKYKGLVNLKYNSNDYKASISVTHDYSGGIMYEILPDQFSFLNDNLYDETDYEDSYIEEEVENVPQSKPLDDSPLHESVRNYKESLANFETKKYKVRIDLIENDLIRYAVWYSNDSISNKPNVVLKNGEWIGLGSGGNGYYEFKSGIYTYKIEYNYMGDGKDPLYVLYVLKNDEVVLTDEAINW